MAIIRKLAAMFKDKLTSLPKEDFRRAPGAANFARRDDFLQRLQRERDRADQTGQEFSLLMFELNDDASNSELAQRLWQVILSSPKAGFSEVGWLSSQSLGVILPNTPFAGGRKFAEDIYRLMPDATSFCSYKIFTYPPQQEAEGEE